MMADSYYSKPQREEYFIDSGYYKFYEAYHLLKFSNEKQILEKAYNEYLDLKKSNLWGNKNYFWRKSGDIAAVTLRCPPPFQIVWLPVKYKYGTFSSNWLLRQFPYMTIFPEIQAG